MGEENEINLIQLNEVRELIKVQKNDPQEVLKKLIADGEGKKDATRLVLMVLYEYEKELSEKAKMEENIIYKASKNELFNKIVNAEKENKKQQTAITVIIIFAIIGPVFNTDSALWYSLAMLVAGVAGYYGFFNKQAAGVAGAELLVMLFPFTCNYYLSGRSHYVNIELLIPLVIAAIPAFLLFFLISKIFYSNAE